MFLDFMSDCKLDSKRKVYKVILIVPVSLALLHCRMRTKRTNINAKYKIWADN